MISSVHTWQHCTPFTNTHTHKTHTPLLVFPLCSPWDHLTLNSRHSLQRKHSRQQLNIQTNANQAMVKAHSGRIYVQKKRRSPGRGDVSQTMSQSVCRVQGDAVRARDSGKRYHIQGCKHITGENHCTTGIAFCHVDPKLKNKTSNMIFLFHHSWRAQRET